MTGTSFGVGDFDRFNVMLGLLLIRGYEHC
jgi:hypothetical protein